MFSGFQSNSFQSNAFQIVRGASEPAPESRGGISPHDYHKYRKHLERLEKLTSEERKYPKRAIEAAEAISELPVEITEIKKLTEGPQLKGTLSLTPKIDYERFQGELEVVRAYIEAMIAHQMMMEQDDEAALLLMLQ